MARFFLFLCRLAIFLGLLFSCGGRNGNGPSANGVGDHSQGQKKRDDADLVQKFNKKRKPIPADDAPAPDSIAERNKICPPAKSAQVYPAILEQQNQTTKQVVVTFDSLRAQLESGCGGCHLAPARETGGFSFFASYAGKKVLKNGVEKDYPGIKDVVDKISGALLTSDPAKQMPIGPARVQNEAAWLELGRRLQAWKNAGFPETSFSFFEQKNPDDSFDKKSDPYANVDQNFLETDIGDCIPLAEQVGYDLQMDGFFAQTASLPKLLSQTDLFTSDSLALARKGTVAYNVEYPLWADNAEKGRFVHLPAQQDKAGNVVRQSAVYSPKMGKFAIPANTRFYKTFYKAVRAANGARHFKKVETRIIVVRYPPELPLLGTYQWNNEQTEAVLVDVPYRDGSYFKDKVISLEIDSQTHESRKYAIPGYQRCVECHQGDAGYILGFTPLQLNRRKVGEGGREFVIGEDELSQMKRLKNYGVLSGIANATDLPKLENSNGLAPRNEHQLRLQGYLFGNCAHCHNSTSGFAIKQGGVNLELTPGALFNFDTRAMRSAHFDRASNKLFVNTKALEEALVKQGEGAFVDGVPSAETLAALRASYLFLRISANSKDRDLLPFNAMPMHTPGGSNCKLVNLTARWIMSLIPNADPARMNIPCNEFQEFSWIDLDNTEPVQWLPRRADWNTPSGMPKNFRELVFDDVLKSISRRKYPVGYYDFKPECSFPEVPSPGSNDPFWQNWMFKGGDSANGLRRPLGELYMIKPGAFFYGSMCAKCHGAKGDGQGPFSTSLNVLSDGDIRVANLINGLFKADGSNLAQFAVASSSSAERNLAGNYFIWMAMGGTKVNFPESVSDLTGKHKALMLNLVRDACSGFLPNAPGNLEIGKIQSRYGLLKDVCFHDNGSPESLPAELGFDPNAFPVTPINPVMQDLWLDKAAYNAGWAIFDYLRSDASLGNWQPKVNECELVYPKQ